jgi:hypothetical protein
VFDWAIAVDTLEQVVGLQASSVGRPQLAAISDESPRAPLLHIHRLY